MSDATAPRPGWLDRLAFSLFDKFAHASLRAGRLTLVLPDGTAREYGSDADVAPAAPGAPAWAGVPGKRATITVRRYSFFWRVITRHDTGLGEAFMAGDFSVDDLGALMAALTANARGIEGARGLFGALNWAGAKLLHAAHLARANTVAGSARNISEHYDAGNEMYALFLDRTLTYSAGIHHEGDTLEAAQLRKLDALLDGARVGPGSHVLEVGCGWGSCAIRAAQRTGCRWTGITVSQEQLTEARARVKAAGVAERVELLFCDYRDVPARFGAAAFDAVVSCEMIEAVGHEHLDTYFDVVGACLKPGGLFAMQVITMPDERYAEYCASSDFIREHIFPGGHLPSMAAMTARASRACLTAVRLRDIGPDYAITLRAWRRAWMQRWADIHALGYPDHFMRKWQFYFAYCEAAFDCRYIHDYQIVWQRGESDTACSAALLHRAAPQLAAGGRNTSSADDAPGLLGSSAVTWALFGVYCVLAGIVIARQPRMLVAALTFAVGQCLQLATLRFTHLVLPAFAQLPLAAQRAWSVDFVEAFTAAPAGVWACSLLVSSSSWAQALQLNDHASGPFLLVGTLSGKGQDHMYCCVQVCAATGLWASHLAGLVRLELYHARATAVVHSAMLLAIFSAAAFKQEHTGLLALTMPGQLCLIPSLVLRYRSVLLPSLPPSWTRLVSAAQWALDVSLRGVLHTVILAVVLAFPQMWSSRLYKACATGGMMYLSQANARYLLSQLRARPRAGHEEIGVS